MFAEGEGEEESEKKLAHLACANLAETTFAEDSVHAEGLVGYRLGFEPLPLKVPATKKNIG
jgi:hypothetical protein